MQADRLQQLLERLTHISIIIDNEYGCHILRAHNDAPQSEASENLPSFALSPPIKRRLTMPDRLYRMMQWGSRANLGFGDETRRWSPTADIHQICLLGRLATSVSMQTGARKVNVGHSPVQA
jgi:hypothetical protein